jgi:CRP-like cAMP-binding protein
MLPDLPKLPNPSPPPLKPFKSSSSQAIVASNVLGNPAPEAKTTASVVLAPSDTIKPSGVNERWPSITSTPLKPTLDERIQQQDEREKQKERYEEWKAFYAELKAWFKRNLPILILNMGSLCTLTAFTRSDVLELRSFAMLGSLSSIIYLSQQRPVLYIPILWGCTFTCINAWKIYDVISERRGFVQLTRDQERIYNRFFLPRKQSRAAGLTEFFLLTLFPFPLPRFSDGITHKQMEFILKLGVEKTLKAGEQLITAGERLENVYLVVEGSTRANILGRHLTAASMNPDMHQKRLGGASGAWVGEMTFLEQFWLKEQKKLGVSTSTSERNGDDTGVLQFERGDDVVVGSSAGREPIAPKGSDPRDDNEEGDVSPSSKVKAAKRLTSNPEAAPGPTVSAASAPMATTSLYSIAAKEDCRVLVWTHADMEKIMNKSVDMRAAMTRAMTAAIVGKVINFAISRSQTSPSWSWWLPAWTSGASVSVSPFQSQTSTTSSTARAGQTADDEDDDDDNESVSLEERLPEFPASK